MTHEEAVLLLSDLDAGGLSEEMEKEVASHLAGCEECRSLSGIRDLLASTLRREPSAAPETHPSSEEIVSYALHANRLRSEKLAAVSSHVRSCPHCRLEVDTVRQAEEASRPRILRFIPMGVAPLLNHRRPGLAAAFAAGIVTIVLVYPAYRGLHDLPRLERLAAELSAENQRSRLESERKLQEAKSDFEQQLDKLRREPAPSGPIRLSFLSGSTRDGAAEEVVQVRAQGQSVYLAVAADPQSIPRADGRCRFEILADRRVVWSWEGTATRIRDDLESPQGSVLLAIPATTLPAGRYQMQLRCDRVRGGESVLRVVFETLR